MYWHRTILRYKIQVLEKVHTSESSIVPCNKAQQRQGAQHMKYVPITTIATNSSKPTIVTATTASTQQITLQIIVYCCCFAQLFVRPIVSLLISHRCVCTCWIICGSCRHSIVATVKIEKQKKKNEGNPNTHASLLLIQLKFEVLAQKQWPKSMAMIKIHVTKIPKKKKIK